MKYNKLILLIIWIGILFVGCKKKQTKSFAVKADSVKNYEVATELPKDVSQPKEKVYQEARDTNTTQEKCNVIDKYGIPLATKLLDTNLLGEANFAQLYPVDSSQRLIKNFNKAFFLGVYSADLVYSVIYDNRSLFYQYYYVVMQLANDLGIKETFTTDMLEKFKENYQSDSADIIIKKSLIKTCQFLDDNNQVSILPFMIIGSWAEATYLMIGNAIYNQDVAMEIYQNIADQRQTLVKLKTFVNDNLLAVDDYNLSIALHKLNSDLDLISQVYEEIYVSDNIAIDKDSLEKLYKAFKQLKSKYL